MGTLDIVILCCFLPAVYLGLKNGLVRQLISVMAIYFGITLSLKFSPQVSEWLLSFLKVSDFAAKAISFCIVFFAIALVLGLIGKWIEKILKISNLGWFNRLLGLVVALIVFAMIISVLVYILDSVNNNLEFISKEKLAESRLYPMALEFSQKVFPFLKEIFAK